MFKGKTNICKFLIVFLRNLSLRWYSDGNQGKYWENMMKIECLSASVMVYIN